MSAMIPEAVREGLNARSVIVNINPMENGVEVIVDGRREFFFCGSLVHTRAADFVALVFHRFSTSMTTAAREAEAGVVKDARATEEFKIAAKHLEGTIWAAMDFIIGPSLDPEHPAGYYRLRRTGSLEVFHGAYPHGKWIDVAPATPRK